MTTTPPASLPISKSLSICTVQGRRPAPTRRRSHAEIEGSVQNNTAQGVIMVDANVSSSPTHARHSGRSSPAERPSSRTDMSPQAPANGAIIGGADDVDTGVKHHDSREPLKDYGWQNLEERFDVTMEERQVAENDIYKEYKTLLAAYTTWAQSSSFHDSERAYKRLRTRMSYVQGAEHGFEEKRQHYIKVVRAFECALALIREA